MSDSKFTLEDVGEGITKTVLTTIGKEIIKHSPEEVKVGGQIGGTAMAVSGLITVAQGAIVGVSMPFLATVGGFIATGAVVGGGIGFIGKKLGWFDN